MPTTRLPSSALFLVALALVAAACSNVAPGEEGDDPFAELDFDEQALTFDCGGADGCSGSGPAWTATYRVGTTATARAELLQTFRVATQLAPSGVVLALRKLRPFTSTSAVGLHVELRELANEAIPSVTGALVASGVIDLRAPESYGTVTVDVSGSGTLQPSTTYALRVFTDDPPADSTGDLIIGVGAIQTSSAAFQQAAITAFGTVLRRANASTSFASPSRYRSAGAWDLATGIAGTPVPAGPIFSESFDGFTGGVQDAVQVGSGLPLWFGRDLTGWTKAGTNVLHAVRWSGVNDALMLYSDNAATQATGIAANASGQTYRVDFQSSPAVYAFAGQATSNAATDLIRVTVLRGNGTALATHTVFPGVWANAMVFTPRSFTYTGDGSGDVRIRIDCANANGRFCGAVDALELSAQ